MSAILRLIDWDTHEVLKEQVRNPINSAFPLELDWRGIFSKLTPVDGYQWHLLLDSCDLDGDENMSPRIEGDNEVYIGYAKLIDLNEYWTQYDDSGKHIDGIRSLHNGNWKIYDPYANRNIDNGMEYANALAESPFYYYVLDTGDCQKPTENKVYRIFVDPDDQTKLKLEYWGNLASTPSKIYQKLLVIDSTDSAHIFEITVKNGAIALALWNDNEENKPDQTGN